MKVLVCAEPGRMKYQHDEIPKPAPDEILIQVKKIGVCGTDLHAFEGTQPYFSYPRILGHELGGVVADANGHTNFSAGDIVSVMPYFFCGKCFSCQMGRTNCCAELKVAGVHIDGGMQEYYPVPAYAAINDTGLSEEYSALVEPFSIGEHALSRAGVDAGDHVLILGAGPIGIGLALLATSRKAKVILADPDEYRLSLCTSIPGIELIPMKKVDLAERVLELTNGDGAAFVFDASGNLRGIESTLEPLAYGGKIILVGLQKEKFAFSHPAFHKKEATLMSSRNATRADFDRVIEYLSGGLPEKFQYISERVLFENAADWFMDPAIQKNRIIKAIIEL